MNDANEEKNYFRRLIEHTRTLYRPDDLGVAQNDPLALLPLGKLEALGLSGESYKLAFTPGLLAQVFRRNGQPLLPDPTDVLGGQGADRGGYLPSQELKADGRFPNSDRDDHWWVPAGRVFLSPGSDDTAAEELAHAREHFFLPHRYRDPFHTNAVSTESFVRWFPGPGHPDFPPPKPAPPTPDQKPAPLPAPDPRPNPVPAPPPVDPHFPPPLQPAPPKPLHEPEIPGSNPVEPKVPDPAPTESGGGVRDWLATHKPEPRIWVPVAVGLVVIILVAPGALLAPLL